jgi:hypothetical protein
VDLWRLEETTPAARAWAGIAYLGAVALHLLLQEIGLRLRRDEHRAWWAGSGRDLLNLAGFAVLGGALRLFGFPAPAAVLVGATLTLLLFGVYVFTVTQTRSPRPRTWALAIGLAAAIPVLAWPGEVLRFFGGMAARLFPM